MLHTIFLIAAVIGGTVMVCQFVLTLLGLGDDATDIGDGGFSGDLSHAGHFGVSGMGIDHDTAFSHAADMDYQHPDSTWLFGVLSFRTIVAAAAFFGVAGVTALSAGYSQGISLAIAMLVGVAAMYGMFWLMRGISQLTSSGNERIGAALGKQATVYIPIPADAKGLGKVHVTLQNRTVEYQAVSDEAAPLRTGETVEIVGVENSDTVNVRRFKETASA
jgi:membrane protein implicated in regulation of membrane protease activity